MLASSGSSCSYGCSTIVVFCCARSIGLAKSASVQPLEARFEATIGSR